VGGAHVVAAAGVEGVALEPVPLVAAPPPVPRRSPAVAARAAPDPLHHTRRGQATSRGADDAGREDTHLVAVAARDGEVSALVRRERRRARAAEAGPLAEKLALGEQLRRDSYTAQLHGGHRRRCRFRRLRRCLAASAAGSRPL
jgi:hypothetical protein